MRETKLPVELPHSIAEALDRGVTIITANQRAARTLRYGFDKRNRQLELPSWKPAAVLSWDAWTRNLWNGLLVEGLASNLLLNNTQEHLIWRRIVSTDPELQNTLRSPDSLAQLAVHAWQLLTQHHAQHRLRSAWSNSETLTFQRWATSFEKLCKTEGLLPAGTLESVLRDAIETGRLHIPTEIGLVGFDEMTPAQFSLIDAVKMANTRVETISTAQMPTRRSLVIVDNDYRS